MARIIYKYEISRVQSNVLIGMPAEAEILCVKNQYERIMLWALVEPDNPKVIRQFYVCYTGEGNEPPEGSIYIGTCIFELGGYVQHIFEVPQL